MSFTVLPPARVQALPAVVPAMRHALPRASCPWCRRTMPYDPATGRFHAHGLPKAMRPGWNAPPTPCPAVEPARLALAR